MKRQITDTLDIINEKSSEIALKRTIEDALYYNKEEGLAGAKRRVTCLNNIVSGYVGDEESDTESLDSDWDSNEVRVASDNKLPDVRKQEEEHINNSLNSATQPAEETRDPKSIFEPIKNMQREGASLDLSKMAQALDDEIDLDLPARVVRPIVAASFNNPTSFSFSATPYPFMNRNESPASAVSPFMHRDNQVQSPFLGMEDSRLKSLAFTEHRGARSFLQSPVASDNESYDSDNESCNSDILTF